MSAKPRDTLVLFVGDLHTGSIYAPGPRAECRNEVMESLTTRWNTFVGRALGEAKGKEFVLMLGGDLVEGKHHNQTEIWTTTHKQQRDAAVQLLMPLTNAASFIYGIRGTSAHAGDEGEDDQTVAEALGAKCANYVWTMTIEDRRLFWAHHGASVARDPQNESNGLYADTKRHYEIALRSGQPPPHVVVHHHVHFAPEPVTAHGITAAICPCWKLQDEHGAKIGPERVPDIGVLAWWPKQDKLERWPFQPPASEYVKIGIKR